MKTVKLNESQLRKLINEMRDQSTDDGAAYNQFMNAIKEIQGVLVKYDLSSYTSGTYDPQGDGYHAAQQWKKYHEIHDLVTNDEVYKHAREQLLGLIVQTDYSDSPLRVGNVYIPDGDYEASSDVVIELHDLVAKTKKGTPRILDSIEFDENYAPVDRITNITY